jgi:predicted nucleic acid-binding protein
MNTGMDVGACPVLIDTCAWIDFLRNTEGGLGNKVTALIRDKRARLCGMVIAELLQGIKHLPDSSTSKEAQALALLIQRVPSLPTHEDDWVCAGNLVSKLRTQGITVSLSDALIASVARRNGLLVLTIDKLFEHLM